MVRAVLDGQTESLKNEKHYIKNQMNNSTGKKK
jgi:hypothetical protein